MSLEQKNSSEMVDEFKTSLTVAKSGAPTGLAEFLQSKFDEEKIIAFVEGKHDKIFYSGQISKFFGDIEIELIECQNKEGVIKTLRSLQLRFHRFPARGFYFFCDSDFDKYNDVETVDCVFYTYHYSIESYMMSCDFLELMLAKHCGKTRARERRQLARQIYNAVQSISISLSPLFAAMCIARRRGVEFDASGIRLMDAISIDREKKSF